MPVVYVCVCVCGGGGGFISVSMFRPKAGLHLFNNSPFSDAISSLISFTANPDPGTLVYTHDQKSQYHTTQP